MSIPAELVDVILQKTRERKLDWRQLSKTGFVASVGEDAISVDQVGSGNYVLRVINNEGNEVERSDATQRFSAEEIYEAARRQALRVEEALMTVRRNLERL